MVIRYIIDDPEISSDDSDKEILVKNCKIG